MKGIILLSHGPMAKGMYETTKWFLGVNIPQYEYLCLEMDDIIEEYDAKVKALIDKVDSGDGVILFTDLVGGTPCNRCVQFMSDRVDLFGGMNLTLVLEQLGKRFGNDYDFDTLLEVAREGIVHLKKPSIVVNEEDDFFD